MEEHISKCNSQAIPCGSRNNRWLNYISHQEVMWSNIYNTYMKKASWMRFQLVGISDRFAKRVTDS